MKYDIENVTEEDMSWDEYSVMSGMTVYTVCIEESGEFAYDDKGRALEGSIGEDIIKAVIEFKEKENE